MIFRKSFLYIILWASFLIGSSQTAIRIDSLRKVVNSATSGNAKVVALCEYSKSLIQDKPDTAFIIAKQAYELANENNFKWGKAHALFAMASVKRATTKYDESINYYNQALDLFKEFDDLSVIASTYNNIGLVNLAGGDAPNALINFRTAIKLYKETKNLSGEAAAVGNIGMVYYQEGNFEKSLEYDSLALLLDQKLNNQVGIATHIGNMGNAYMFRASVYKGKGMEKEMQIMYNKAIEAMTYAYNVNEQMNNKEGMALQIGNMANLFYDMGNLEKTMEYYNKALKICEDANDKVGMSRQYGNIGWVLFEAKEYSKAIEHTKKAIELLTDFNDLSLKYNWYDNITGMYEASGDYRAAYESYQQFILLRDSLFNVDRARKTLEAQMNIEFDRKEESAKQEREKQAIIRNVFIGGFVVALLMGLIVLRGYRNKQKANQLISKQKELLEEKNKEITDSIKYAKRIQNAHMPSSEYISKKLNELKTKT